MVLHRNPLGVMQGRLLPPVNNKIQAFPEQGWQKEFSFARELNLDCIEFIFDGDNHLDSPLLNDEALDEIRQLEIDTGVKVLSVCADYFMDHPLHGTDNEIIEKSIDVLSSLINNCAKLNISDLVIPCVDQSRFRDDADIKDFINSIKECLPAAKESGLKINLETDLPPIELLNLAKTFDSPFFRINYDIGNSAACGYNPNDEIAAYGEYISDVHIKDRILNGPSVPLGNGNADLETVFQKLNKIGFSGIFILQSARQEKAKEKETVASYIEFVNKLMDESGFRQWI